MSTDCKPTIRQLRAEAERLGLNEANTGGLDALLRCARQTADPVGYLQIHAPAPPAARAAVDASAPGEGGADISQEMDDAAPPENPPAALHETPPATPLSVALPPLGEVGPRDYLGRHVEVQRMTAAQARTLRRLQIGLDAAGCRLASGRRCLSASDAIRWLLEAIASA